jgi:hypothetical protein
MSRFSAAITPYLQKNWHFIVLFLAHGLIYADLIIQDPVLERDDITLLGWVQAHPNLGDIFGSPAIPALDIQPIRDLSYLLDLTLKAHLPFWSFHLSNVLIWLLGLLGVWSCFTLLHPPSFRQKLFFILFCLHPVFVGSVAWIAARNHLLSFCFSMWGTYHFLHVGRNPEKGWHHYLLVPFFLCAALFSHPMGLAWPIWAFLYARFHNSIDHKKVKALIITCGCIAFALFIANYRYYNNDYVTLTAQTEILPDTSAYLPLSFLAMGRYFFNFLLPFKISVTYFPGAWWNLIGLGLLPIFGAILLFCIEIEGFLLWFASALFFLMPVTAVMTNVFVSDTYILLASFILINATIFIVGSFKGFFSLKRMRAVLICIAFLFAWRSYQEQKAWHSDLKLWQHAYETEITPDVLASYGNALLKENNFPKALKVITELEEFTPAYPGLPLLKGKAIYQTSELSTVDKIKALESSAQQNHWTAYYLAQLYTTQDKVEKAYWILDKALKKKADYGKDQIVIEKFRTHLCKKAEIEHCL